MKRIFDITRLVDVTWKLMKENGIKYSECIKGSPRDPNSIWGKICSAYFGEFSFPSSLTVQTKWNRDSESYATRVKKTIFDSENLVHRNIENTNIASQYDEKDSKKSFIKKINISTQEWENIQKNIRQRCQRFYFTSEINFYISRKLQEEALPCWVRVIWNWLSYNDDKTKIKSWNSRFKCIECDESFKCRIVISEDKQMVLVAEWEKNPTHPPCKDKPRCSGTNRDNLKLRLRARKAHNVSNENSIYNSLSKDDVNFLPRPTNLGTLRKAKSECIDNEILGYNLLADISATKTATDSLINFYLQTGYLKGFIQEIHLNPFGILLVSDIQIKMWIDILSIYPFLFFDATGSIMRRVENQKTVLLYSIVAYDPRIKKNIPIAEFITTSHTTSSISKYLFVIKEAFLNYMQKKFTGLAPIIVTDQSWALINSVLKIFNNCSVGDYLNWAFSLLNDSNEQKDALDNLMKTRIFICSSHFLKACIRQAMKKKPKKRVKRAFSYFVSLLINSETVNEFDNHLINIYLVLHQKLQTKSLLRSLNKINASLIERKLTSYKINDDELLKNEIISSKTGEENKSEYLVSNENLENIKKESPFQDYYENLIKSANNTMNKESINKKQNTKENPFYCPKLFNIINCKLYLMPLWSGVILNKWFKQNPKYNCEIRLSNNPVENYFKILKHNILQNRKPNEIKPSLFTSLAFENVLAKYFEYFNKNAVRPNLVVQKEKEKEDIKNKVKKKQKPLSKREETWKKGPKKRQMKGIYFDKTENIGGTLSAKIEKKINNIRCDSFRAIFDLNKDVDFSDEELNENASVSSTSSSIYETHKQREQAQLQDETLTKSIATLNNDEIKNQNEARPENLSKSSINIIKNYKEKPIARHINSDLKTFLQANSLKIIKTPMDGHCFLHAIRYSLEHNGRYDLLDLMSAENLKYKFENELITYYDNYYSAFMKNCPLDVVLMQLKEYFENRNWNQDIVDIFLPLLSNTLQIHITLYFKQPNGFQMQEYSCTIPKAVIKLYLHDQHYDCIVEIN